MTSHQELMDQIVVFSEDVVERIQRHHGILPTEIVDTSEIRRRLREHIPELHITFIDEVGELIPPEEYITGFRVREFWESLIDHAIPLDSIVNRIKGKMKELGIRSFRAKMSVWVGIFGYEHEVERMIVNLEVE